MINIKKIIDKYGIYIIIVILLIISFSVQRCSHKKVVNSYKEELALRQILSDSLNMYKNKYNNIVFEKSVIQVELKKIKKFNDELTENQENLLDKISKLEKDKRILAASNMKMSFTIDSLTSINDDNKYEIIDEENKSIQLITKDKYFDLTLLVDNVIPYNDSLNVKHYIQSLNVYNEMFINFNYSKKNNKPISFNIVNSNPHWNITDVDSYIIPEINPNNINDTKFKKFKTKLKKNVKYLYMGIGVGVGILIGGAM